MTHYSVQSRDWRLIKGYEFAKNMGRNVGKNIIKKLSSKYSQNLLHHAKTICYNALKATSKRVIQKTAEATGDLIGNKTVDKITMVSKSSPQNNSEANEKEIPISPELIHKIINDPILNEENYWWSKIKNYLIISD